MLLCVVLGLEFAIMPEYALYPIFLDLRGQPVLIVGGGSVGLRKARGLIATGARLTVVSPNFCEEIELLDVARLAQDYDASHMTMERWRLVFAATDAAQVNTQVAYDAAAAGLLCCRCDDPEESDFVSGAMGSKGGITIAVSTGKAAPVLAGRVRDAAVDAIDPLLVTWTQRFSAWRTQVLAQVRNATARRQLLQRLAGPEMEELLRRAGAAGAEKAFARWLAAARRAGSKGARGGR